MSNATDSTQPNSALSHDDVIKWKLFPRNWPYVRGIHRSPVNSPHKGQWRGALMFSLICAWINAWLNNREVGDLKRHRAHCDVIVMQLCFVLGHLQALEWNGYRVPYMHWNRTWSTRIVCHPLLRIHMQSSAVITRSNLSRHYIRYCENSGRNWIRY